MAANAVFVTPHPMASWLMHLIPFVDFRNSFAN